MYKASDVVHPAPARCASQQLHLKGRVVNPWTKPSPRRHPASLYEPLGTPDPPKHGLYTDDARKPFIHPKLMPFSPGSIPYSIGPSVKEKSLLPSNSASSSSRNLPPKESLDGSFTTKGLNPKHKAVPPLTNTLYATDSSSRDSSPHPNPNIIYSPLQISNFYTENPHFVQNIKENGNSKSVDESSTTKVVNSPSNLRSYNENLNSTSSIPNIQQEFDDGQLVDFELYYDQTQDDIIQKPSNPWSSNSETSFKSRNVTKKSNTRKKR